MSRFLTFSLAAVLLAGTLTLYWRWPAGEGQAPASSVAAQPQAAPFTPSSASAVPAAAQAQPSAAAALPSLAGTEVDGRLQTDAAGNLLLELAVRDYFDYFLSAVDHSGLDAVIEALLADAGRRLPEPALGQLISLLGDYLDYKRASMALMQQPLDAHQQVDPQAQLQVLQAAFERLDALRRAHFPRPRRRPCSAPSRPTRAIPSTVSPCSSVTTSRTRSGRSYRSRRASVFPRRCVPASSASSWLWSNWRVASSCGARGRTSSRCANSWP